MLLDFFWHTRGSVRIASSASSALVMEYVADLLDSAGKSVRYERDDYATFEGPWWGGPMFPGPWVRLLMPYDRGRFGIAQTRSGRSLRYEFRSLYLLLFTLAVSAVACLGEAVHDGVGSGLRFGAIIFAGVFLLIKVQSAVLLPPAILRVVERA